MYRGLPASVLLHAGVLGASMIVLPYVERPAQRIEIVPIDIVNISDITNVASIVPNEDAPEPETEEPPPPPVPDVEDLLEDVDTIPEEVAPEEEVAPPPPPEEKKPDIVEDIVPEEKPPEKKPKPEPEPEPEPEKRDALDDLLSDDSLFETPDLLDLAEKEPVRAPVRPNLPTEEPRQEVRREARRGAGERTANEARVEALLWSQMEICWGTVSDLPDPERLGVTVLVKLNPDGTLRGDVELVAPRRVPIGDRFMGQAVDRALRAARKCQPYRLPEDDYEVWREITMNFRHDG